MIVKIGQWWKHSLWTTPRPVLGFDDTGDAQVGASFIVMALTEEKEVKHTQYWSYYGDQDYPSSSPITLYEHDFLGDISMLQMEKQVLQEELENTRMQVKKLQEMVVQITSILDGWRHDPSYSHADAIHEIDYLINSRAVDWTKPLLVNKDGLWRKALITGVVLPDGSKGVTWVNSAGEPCISYHLDTDEDVRNVSL